ncbi:hypothetical protein Tco_0413516 [Tanacetum coccineum]
MMVQHVEEIGEDSDNPTDSTSIPIIDQPSSSSQPKKDKLSKKVQRQEAEVLDLQKEKDTQAKEIDALKKRIQRLERMKISRPAGLKRLRKVGMSRRVESSVDQESLGVPEDASKQGRRIEDIDADICNTPKLGRSGIWVRGVLLHESTTQDIYRTTKKSFENDTLDLTK